MAFYLKSEFSPTGDQPAAIAKLVAGFESGEACQTLLGVTGSGKTFTVANVIAQLDRPALVLAHNKTLAAQLCSEFREFFPDSAVEYFVSYYDYYQPEAYIASRDVYIEKEADINKEIERLRHSATRSLLMRRDVIIVASVSCIYGLGLPDEYMKGVIPLKVGTNYNRAGLLRDFQKIRYERHDVELQQGRYRVKGEVIDLFPSWEESVIRLSFFGDELEQIQRLHSVSLEVIEILETVQIFPATHYVVNEGLDEAIILIKRELETRLAELRLEGKDLEAHRLEQRTNYDMEMMAEMGYCKGIENYSRLMSGRLPGEPPGVLLDFFPPDFLTIIDESHATIPQIGGMFNGDQARKKSLVDYGFRLPSAMDNRPLRFAEFEAKIGQVLCVSATPGSYEIERSVGHVVEQIIRPTGLLDPHVVIKSTAHQVEDLLAEIKVCVAEGDRVLVSTITKKMSEDLSDFLDEKGVKVRYLHSDIKALDRIDILHALRLGTFDVLVGVNLLREGLDLPEVALVAILDADKEGFLRNERSLIQTMGRAARHVKGRVILYADKLTQSIKSAVNETNRRREIQMSYNEAHGIIPQSIKKRISDIRDADRKALAQVLSEVDSVTPERLPKLLSKLRKDMKAAAENLEFELAAVLRDQIEALTMLAL